MSKRKSVSKPRINAADSNQQSEKTQRREEFVRENTGFRLLGEIITWRVGMGGVKHVDLVQALKDAGLNEKVARELLPRHAFTRAARKLSEDRVIDPVNENDDSIRFQFTKRFMEENEWKYTTECYLELDKQLGKVTCKTNPDLEAKAQQLLDEAMENRTTADVSKIIQKLFDAEADLFPIRDQGGVYFVPDQFSGFTEKIETFLGKLGGRVSRFPVPADTKQGDKSVQEAILDGLAQIIHDHEEAVNEFGLDTRHDTITRQAERIKQTRVKVEAYANYLQERKEELLQSIDSANNRLTQRVQELTEERAKAPVVQTEGGANRAYLFSYSVTAVLRWMGKREWKFKAAKKVLDYFVGAGKISDATIRAQLLGGRNGERGEIPELTEEQAKRLEEVRDQEDQPPTNGVQVTEGETVLV